jgi:hypothetical protein
VHQPLRVVDGAGRGDEGLAGDLAAEDPLAVLVGRAAAEDVDLDRLEREEGDEIVEGRLHGAIVARGLRRRPAPPPGGVVRPALRCGP